MYRIYTNHIIIILPLLDIFILLHSVFRGTTNSHIFFQDSTNQWILQSLRAPTMYLETLNKLPDHLPIGTHIWSVMSEDAICRRNTSQTHELTFTTCFPMKYTCDSGHCIPLRYVKWDIYYILNLLQDYLTYLLHNVLFSNIHFSYLPNIDIKLEEKK